MQASFARCIRCSQVPRNWTTCFVSEAQQRRMVTSYAPTKNTKRYSSSKSTSDDRERLHAQKQQSPKQSPAPSKKARANSSQKAKPKSQPKPKPKPEPEKVEYIHSDPPTVEDSRFDFDQPNPRKKPRSPIPVMEGDTFPKDTAAGLSDLLKENPVNDAKALFGILAGWLLRHEARNMGYGVAPDGFVRVSDVLRFPPFSTYSIAEFARLIEGDEKDRFEMTRLPDFIEGVIRNVWWVRARHMHSIPGVNPHNKRILKTEKLQIVEYRTQLENWDFIRANGIPEDANHLIRLHRPPGKGLFLEHIPDRQKILSVTIDSQKAVQLGVMFYHTADVKLYAVGTREKGVIPFEACRSAIILDVNKETLK